MLITDLISRRNMMMETEKPRKLTKGMAEEIKVIMEMLYDMDIDLDDAFESIDNMTE